ncbi:MAG: AtpZ/AtpI family protein [Pirellulales bacterium]|nr:AtpZ/AtpI family protein [Pirellulales bacterium]
MGKPHDERNPMVAAMAWVSRITTVAIEMVLPGVVGSWLDRRWGTGFLALTGFAIGVSVGMWHLLKMVRPRDNGPDQEDSDRKSDGE